MGTRTFFKQTRWAWPTVAARSAIVIVADKKASVIISGASLWPPSFELLLAYVGQTRSRALIQRLISEGIGECTTRGEVPPRRVPWFFDNGAFKDYRAKRDFDCAAYLRALKRVQQSGITPPDFAVVPDIVAGGMRSLMFSELWRETCRAALPGVPLYLAVQPGQDYGAVAACVQSGGYAGLLVGGDVEWKLATGAKWRALTRTLGIACHVGRVGTNNRVLWARRIGVDSIDSSLPLWSKESLKRFLDALNEPID